MHGQLPPVDLLPAADCYLLAGDYCRDHRVREWYTVVFHRWLEKLSARGKVIGVAGNHDFVFQDDPWVPESLPWTYLCDSWCDVGGFMVWGSPWQPRFFDWAFNLDEPELAAKWDLIPPGTDILITHGPPYSVGDATRRGEMVGSLSLYKRLAEVRPLLHVFGHIHEGYGRYEVKEATLVNASFCGENYDPVNQPIVVEL
jgi:Icc-related predicted phosphoesterase